MAARRGQPALGFLLWTRSFHCRLIPPICGQALLESGNVSLNVVDDGVPIQLDGHVPVEGGAVSLGSELGALDVDDLRPIVTAGAGRRRLKDAVGGWAVEGLVTVDPSRCVEAALDELLLDAAPVVEPELGNLHIEVAEAHFEWPRGGVAFGLGRHEGKARAVAKGHGQGEPRVIVVGAQRTHDIVVLLRSPETTEGFLVSQDVECAAEVVSEVVQMRHQPTGAIRGGQIPIAVQGKRTGFRLGGDWLFKPGFCDVAVQLLGALPASDGITRGTRRL